VGIGTLASVQVGQAVGEGAGRDATNRVARASLLRAGIGALTLLHSLSSQPEIPVLWSFASPLKPHHWDRNATRIPQNVLRLS